MTHSMYTTFSFNQAHSAVPPLCASEFQHTSVRVVWTVSCPSATLSFGLLTAWRFSALLAETYKRLGKFYTPSTYTRRECQKFDQKGLYKSPLWPVAGKISEYHVFRLGEKSVKFHASKYWKEYSLLIRKSWCQVMDVQGDCV